MSIGNSRNLMDYMAVLAKHKWLIVGIMVLAIVASIIVTIMLPAKYETKAVVMLSKTCYEAFRTPTALTQVITSDELLEKVVAKTGTKDEIKDLRSQIRAENISGTTSVVITVTAPDEKQAKEVADTLAAEFLIKCHEIDPSEKQISDQLSKSEKMLADVNETLNQEENQEDKPSDEKKRDSFHIAQEKLKDIDLGDSLNNLEKALLYVGVSKQVNSLEEQRISLQTSINDLNIQSLQLGKSQIVASPAEPVQVSTSLVQNILVALLASLIVGSTLAFVIDSLGQPGGKSD